MEKCALGRKGQNFQTVLICLLASDWSSRPSSPLAPLRPPPVSEPCCGHWQLDSNQPEPSQFSLPFPGRCHHTSEPICTCDRRAGTGHGWEGGCSSPRLVSLWVLSSPPACSIVMGQAALHARLGSRGALEHGLSSASHHLHVGWDPPKRGRLHPLAELVSPGARAPDSRESGLVRCSHRPGALLLSGQVG